MSAQGGRRPCVRGSCGPFWAGGKKTSCPPSNHCVLGSCGPFGTITTRAGHRIPTGTSGPTCVLGSSGPFCTISSRTGHRIPRRNPRIDSSARCGAYGLLLRPLLACRLWCGGRRRAQLMNGVTLARCAGPGSSSGSLERVERRRTLPASRELSGALRAAERRLPVARDERSTGCAHSQQSSLLLFSATTS